jgi:predicted nucleic acid-binding protein
MNGVDTNILIYSMDRSDLVKRAKARILIRQLRTSPPSTVLLWQVAGEFVRYLRFRQDRGEITGVGVLRYLNTFRRTFPLTFPTTNVLDRALDLANRYSLSHWDSMLLGACLVAQVDTLYTEDMGAPTTIESIRLINPFI